MIVSSRRRMNSEMIKQSWSVSRAILVIIFLCAAIAIVSDSSPAYAQTPAQFVVLESNANHIVFELQISAYERSSTRIGNATYTVLSVPGLGYTSEAGKPSLPIKGAMFGIPPGAQASLRIVVDRSRTDTVTDPILPGAAAQIQSDPREGLPRYIGEVRTPNPAVYSANQFYPAGAARIASSGNWRSQRYVSVELHPLQYNPATRQLLFHQQLRVEIVFSYPQGLGPAALGGSVNEGPFEAILKDSLANYSTARNWRTRNSVARPRAPQALPPSAGPWYKIGVTADGIYQVTCGQLAAAAGSPLSINPGTLQMYKQGTELAIKLVDNGGWNNCSPSDTSDYIEFFGQAPNSKYTNTNVYWLTYGNPVSGQRMSLRDGSGAGTVSTTYTNTVHLEQNINYRPGLVSAGGDHWWWTLFYSGGGGVMQATYPVSATNPATGSYTATLQTDMFGGGSSNETVLRVNGNQIDDSTWAAGERLATIPFPQAYLISGSNTISITQPTATIAPAFLNYLELSYQSTYAAVGDQIRFKQPDATTSWEYQISGFSNSAIEAFDIADPFNVVQISNASVSTPCPCTLQFTDPVLSAHEYIALAPAARLTPASVTLDTPSNLHDTSNGADYIIIAYGGSNPNVPSFIPSVQPLAGFRASQGMRVKVVDVQDVYDEFNDGLVDPQAIRDFLQYTYTNWQPPAPSFVLLVGSGNFDPKGYCVPTNACPQVSTPPNSTLIPPNLQPVDPILGETASDNRLVSFHDNDADPSTRNTLPDMAIGRLPAYTVADVNAMVAKILAYEQNPPSGNWRSTVSFVADNAYNSSGVIDPASNFWAYSDEVASDPYYMPAGVRADRIYYNPCPNTYPQCVLPYPSYPDVASTRAAIISAINSGRLIVNYVGHAAIQFWASESLFSIGSLSSLSNGNKLPVMLEMTCYSGYFIYPGVPSLAESEIRLSGNGAVASWAATGLGVTSGHDFLDKGFFDAVMNQDVRQIGLATTAGKVNLWLNGGGGNLDLIDTFDLLGDPATRLQIQFAYYLPWISRQP
jgi:hypothetical protein